MDTEYGANRWWEYYAVRYLMPSVAGVVIVKWLCSHGERALLTLLSLPSADQRIDTPSLVLLFLYGNLFCYIASYPVLVFHATRVLDFSDDKWTGQFFSGYTITILLAAVAFLLTLAHQECRYWAAFVLVAAFAIIQLRRLWRVLGTRVVVDKCHGVDGKEGGTVTLAYGYSYSLSRRRGKVTETTTTTDPDDDEQVSKTRRELWHKDYMETYRHLREHGNSAFIFLLELALAALVYCVITGSVHSEQRQVSAVGILFAIWAVPAVFVHLLAQHLERRFSWFDRRLEKDQRPTRPVE